MEILILFHLNSILINSQDHIFNVKYNWMEIYVSVFNVKYQPQSLQSLFRAPAIMDIGLIHKIHIHNTHTYKHELHDIMNTNYVHYEYEFCVLC